MQKMSERLIELAFALEDAAQAYKKEYEKEHGGQPVILLERKDTRSGVFIADGFHTQKIRAHIGINTIAD